MPAPAKFAHIVYKTHNFDEMIEWYVNVFDARVQNKTDSLAFLTYDDEHHRFAFLNLGPKEDGSDSSTENLSLDPSTQGVHHVAYTWNTLDELLAQYKLMKSLGNNPVMCLRHGPTLSIYYADPDGNGMEFQIDLLPVEDANAFMESDTFHANPIGESFDPEDLLAAQSEGKSLIKMVLRSDQTEPEEGLTV